MSLLHSYQKPYYTPLTLCAVRYSTTIVYSDEPHTINVDFVMWCAANDLNLPFNVGYGRWIKIQDPTWLFNNILFFLCKRVYKQYMYVFIRIRGSEPVLNRVYQPYIYVGLTVHVFYFLSFMFLEFNCYFDQT